MSAPVAMRLASAPEFARGPMNDDQRPTDARVLAAELASRHHEFLAFLERRTHDRALAEDLLQDAYLKGLHKLTELRDPGAAAGWFFQVLRRVVVDQQRRGGTASRALAAFASELEASAPAEETEAAVCRCVAEVADGLKPEYVEALRRVEVDGLAVKDLATEAGITANNAGVRVFRARAALKKGVEKTCGACAANGCAECTCGT